MKHRLERIVIIIAALLALFLFTAAIAGWAYEQVGRNRDRHLYPQVGNSIDIGGRSLNLYCSGQGGPAVIFEAGGEVWGIQLGPGSAGGGKVHPCLLVRPSRRRVERSSSGPAHLRVCCR